MSDDLVRRLRRWMDMDAGDERRTLESFSALMNEAADRIEALEAAVKPVPGDYGPDYDIG